MAILGKLIVNVDADLTGLRNQIKAAESVMRQSAKSLGNLSASLTQAITLPFAAIGIGSIKAAADLNRLTDGLQTTMLDAGRSVFSVQSEIGALREEALKPGLDFEQAVKGSLRLQGVGLSAERAREILVQFGNAVAVAGGTADNLNSVTVQLAQIIGKGRVLTADLNIIKENMPSVAQAMIKAFGTADAEGIQKLGLSADVFVDKLTKQLATLPRATGGLANAITNVFSAIKQSAADLGNVLATKLNVAERLEQLSVFVLGLADSFKALSPVAQDTVLGFAAFALAIGPAIKIGSLFVSTIGGISVVLAQMRQAFAAIQVGGFLGWFQNLNSVVKANLLGVLVGVALAAAAAFALLGKNTDAAAKTQQALIEINKQASDNVAEERVKVGLLVDVLKSETTTRDEKAEALKKLNAISPEYFKGLSTEKLGIDQLNLAYDGYINSILRAARAKAAEGKLIELDKQALEIAEKKNNAVAQAANFVVPDRPRAANANGIGDLQDQGARAASLAIQAKANSDIQIKAFDVQAAAIKQQMDALKGLIKANTDLVPTEEQKTAALAANRKALADNAAAAKAGEAATKDAGKQAKVYAEALADIQKEVDKAAITGTDAFEAQADAIGRALDKVLDAGFSKGSKEVQGLIEKMKTLKSTVETVGPLNPLAQTTPGAPVSETAGFAPVAPIEPVPQEVLTSYALLPEYLQAWQDKVAEAQQTMATFWDANGAAMQAASDAMVQFGGVIESSLGDANSSWNDFAQAAKAAIVGVIANLIKLAVANAVTKAFATSPNPLFGAALAAIAGGLAAGIFKRLVGAAKFAQGTLGAPGGRALVGEEGPELVNLPSSSGIRIPAKETAAVLGAFTRASGSVQSVQQSAQKGLTVVGQSGPEFVNLPAGAQVIPAPQTRQVLTAINRTLTERIRRGLAVPAYATGTLSARGGRSLVGERGPELLNLPGVSGLKLSTLQAKEVLNLSERIRLSVEPSASLRETPLPKFAFGTLSAPGGLSLVGERGPELVNLSRGAQVIPSLQTERILSTLQGSGAQQVEVGGTFRIAGTDLVVVLEKAQRNLGRIR